MTRRSRHACVKRSGPADRPRRRDVREGRGSALVTIRGLLTVGTRGEARERERKRAEGVNRRAEEAGLNSDSDTRWSAIPTRGNRAGGDRFPIAARGIR